MTYQEHFTAAKSSLEYFIKAGKAYEVENILYSLGCKDDEELYTAEERAAWLTVFKGYESPKPFINTYMFTGSDLVRTNSDSQKLLIEVLEEVIAADGFAAEVAATVLKSKKCSPKQAIIICNAFNN